MRRHVTGCPPPLCACAQRDWRVAQNKCINTPRHAPIMCKSTPVSLLLVVSLLLQCFAMSAERTSRRKKNFSHDERAIILAGMERHYDRLHGSRSKTTSKGRRDEILQRITDQVNAVGNEARRPHHIGKKINDLRRRVKDKMALMARHARGTGGGPASRIRLTPDEEVVARCLTRVQVEGMPGYDSVHPPLRTGVQDEAGPSRAPARPTPSPDDDVPARPTPSPDADVPARPTPSSSDEDAPDPQGRQAALVEESGGHASIEEVLQDAEHLGEEVSLSLFMEDLGSLAGPSRTSSPRSSISSDSISNPATPSVSIPNPPPPSNPSPYARPEASRGPRRSTRRTRGVPELLSVTLTTAQEDQTRLMGAMGQDFTRVADSLGERGHVTDVIQDIAGNTTAIITCLRDLETTTASLVKEVQTLNESVQGHTAAIVGVQTETNNLLRRIAVALEGRPPAPVDAPLPDATPPPSTRQLRSRGRGRGRRQAN